MQVYHSPNATVINYHTLCDLNNTDLLPYSSGVNTS